MDGKCGVCGQYYEVCICKLGVKDWRETVCTGTPFKDYGQDKKYDQGKPMVGLIKEDFPRALLAISEVAAYGIKKYNKRGSWKEVENSFNRYKDALGRHDLHSEIEDYDEESGLLHLAHLAWNALAILELKLNKEPND